MLNKKVALITGAASGIGRASAVALAMNGAAVVVADRDLSGLCETVALITEAKGRAMAVAADITCDGDMAEAVAFCISHFGELHIGVNAAGGGDRSGRITELCEADFDTMVGLNLKGTFLSMRHQLKRMLEQGKGGTIVNISSTAGIRGIRDASLYAAAKHGVIGLTKCAALDYAPHGIRINVICPGAVATPQFDRVLARKMPGLDAIEARRRADAAIPLGRVGAPKDVADMVAWLASDNASYLTGQALILDGGATI